jgi:hypothetical protein
MFSTTRVLIRWARGLISVGDDGPEQFVEIAGVQDYEQAKQLGEALLEASKGTRQTLAVQGGVYTPAQQPGAAYEVVDRMGVYQIQSIAISTDDEAYTVVTPELGDPKQKRLDAINRRLVRASAGATSEFAAPGAPRQPEGQGMGGTPPEFSTTWDRVSGGSA